MRFSDALQNVEAAATKGPACGMAKVFAALDKVDAEALQAALDGTVPHSYITQALSVIGFKLSSQTVGRHRRGDCSCG